MIKVLFLVGLPILPGIYELFAIFLFAFTTWKVGEKFSFIEFENKVMRPECVIERVVDDELMVTSR